MVSGRTKRVVVLRDIHSNIIEEAILILKGEHDDREIAGKDSKKEDVVKKEGKRYELLLKEANIIIENYIRDNKSRGLTATGTQRNRGMAKKLFSKGTVINLAFAGSLLLLGFILFNLMK